MATTPRLMTADELLALPDDGLRHELIRGEMTTATPASAKHGEVAGTLHGLLFAYVRAHRLGKVYAAETGFKLESDPDTVRAPDVAFVTAERLETVVAPKGFGVGAPDLAAEVISPGDRYAEVEDETDAWLTAGVSMVLVVHPRRRTVEVHRPRQPLRTLTEHEILDGEDVVPGWRLRVGELFE